jgi:hypothetical protein
MHYAAFIAFPESELLPTIQRVKRLDDGRVALPLSDDAILWGEVVDDKQLTPSICEAAPCESARHENVAGPSSDEPTSLELSRVIRNKITTIKGLVIDRGRFCVTYKGKCCDLKNTMAFRVIERLAHARGVFLTVKELMCDLWGDKVVSDEAVQRQVSFVRCKLRDAGIEGVVLQTQHDSYRLILR